MMERFIRYDLQDVRADMAATLEDLKVLDDINERITARGIGIEGPVEDENDRTSVSPDSYEKQSILAYL